MPDLMFTPLKKNNLELKNRFVMAPMTRSRAPLTMPTDSMVTYYKQRASAGLIITEGVNISEQAIGSPFTPGAYTQEQIDGWKKVVEAVHAEGGKIFMQLWHTGRVSHSSLKSGEKPVAPSAIAIEGQKTFTLEGMKDFEVPRELTTSEVESIVVDYANAAKGAKEAGFDGVELHGAFGYLPNQFLVDGANKRTDKYGGSIANRSRFVLEIMDGLVKVMGTGKVGIKISPSIYYNNMFDSDPKSLFTYLIKELNKLPLAYIHLMEALFPLENFPHYPSDVKMYFWYFG